MKCEMNLSIIKLEDREEVLCNVVCVGRESSTNAGMGCELFLNEKTGCSKKWPKTRVHASWLLWGPTSLALFVTLSCSILCGFAFSLM
ncbi:hypothetical protein VNO78_31086 [Psophocarpus tetragonolobus]|uniref:Transmembrane protein n=1 Tax=Psophocarpus tetragonolobus TaxID=3891 RepID=A0AAN9RYC4_PSOTE